MGRLLPPTASAHKIMRSITVTLALAEATDPDMLVDAEEYLGDSVIQMAEVEDLMRENGDMVLRARAQLKAGNERCNDLIQQVREEFYNLVGRASRDPIYLRVFLGGGKRYTSFKPGEKPVALELLARALEAHRHRRVKDEDVARLTTKLRDEAARMRAIREQLEPAVVEGRLLLAQRTATVREAHRQLTSLKRHWLNDGLSEAEIHEVIPSWGKKKASTSDTADAEDAGSIGEDAAEDESDTDDFDLEVGGVFDEEAEETAEGSEESAEEWEEDEDLGEDQDLDEGEDDEAAAK